MGGGHAKRMLLGFYDPLQALRVYRYSRFAEGALNCFCFLPSRMTA